MAAPAPSTANPARPLPSNVLGPGLLAFPDPFALGLTFAK